MIVPMKHMLETARADGYALGAFEFWSLDSAQAVIEAAEEVGVPVILQAGPLELAHGGVDELARIGRSVAEGAGIDVALHLDHGDTFDMARACVEAGFSSVMIDASHVSYEENVDITCRVVEIAAPRGVSVESELGKLAGSEAGKSLSEEEAAQTDPDEAVRFVEETGIDALAVAIGTAHGLYKLKPRLNLKRLDQIARKVEIPLVLHGGSDTPADQVRQAIALGISKVNICTEFIAAFGKAYVDAQLADGFKYNVPSLFGAGKSASRALAESKIRFFAGE